MDFSFKNWIISNGWKPFGVSQNIYEKGTYTIRLLGSKRMIILNNSNEVKHKHIITCKFPSNEYVAEELFNLINL